MKNELKVKLTPEERDSCLGAVAIGFAVFKDDRIVITEYWAEESESYGPYTNITIPKRVWAKCLAWLAAREAKPAKDLPTPPKEQ